MSTPILCTHLEILADRVYNISLCLHKGGPIIIIMLGWVHKRCPGGGFSQGEACARLDLRRRKGVKVDRGAGEELVCVGGDYPYSNELAKRGQRPAGLPGIVQANGLCRGG